MRQHTFLFKMCDIQSVDVIAESKCSRSRGGTVMSRRGSVANIVEIVRSVLLPLRPTFQADVWLLQYSAHFEIALIKPLWLPSQISNKLLHGSLGMEKLGTKSNSKRGKWMNFSLEISSCQEWNGNANFKR